MQAVRSFELVNKNVETSKRIIANYRNERIYLWTGLSAAEIITTARLLYNFQVRHNNISVFDFSNFTMKNARGEEVHPEILGATDLSRVNEIHKHFRPLTEDELLKFRELWKRVKVTNSLVWILDNGQIIDKDETYFDSFLLSRCTNEFQTPARVVGHTLCDTNFNVGDAFLNYRLKQLTLMQKLEYRGAMKEMRDYEVRLSQ